MVGLTSGLTKPRTRGESLLGFDPVVFVGIPLQLSDLLRPLCCKARATAIWRGFKVGEEMGEVDRGEEEWGVLEGVWHPEETIAS